MTLNESKASLDIAPKDALDLLLKAECHRGEKKMQKKMSPYIYKKSSDGEAQIFDLNKTWQKIRAAARLLVAVEDKSNICLVASTVWAKRSIFKFSQYTGAYSVSGRFTPGTFTNQICKHFVEPTALIASDPDLDRQAITEASYVNVPVIALCNSNTKTENIDVVIPCNNQSKFAVAAVYFLLSREVLRMAGSVPYASPWDVQVDLFIFKTPEELEKRVQDDARASELDKKLAAEQDEKLAAEEDEQSAYESAEPAEPEKMPECAADANSTDAEAQGQKVSELRPEEGALKFATDGIPQAAAAGAQKQPAGFPYYNLQHFPFMGGYPYGPVGSEGRMAQGFMPQEMQLGAGRPEALGAPRAAEADLRHDPAHDLRQKGCEPVGEQQGRAAPYGFNPYFSMQHQYAMEQYHQAMARQGGYGQNFGMNVPQDPKMPQQFHPNMAMNPQGFPNFDPNANFGQPRPQPDQRPKDARGQDPSRRAQ